MAVARLDDMIDEAEKLYQEERAQYSPMGNIEMGTSAKFYPILSSLKSLRKKYDRMVSKADKERGKEGGFAKGFADNFDLLNTLSSGWMDVAKGIDQLAVRNKAARGEKLTPEEQLYMRMFDEQARLEGIIEAEGGATRGYNIGSGLAENIPFITSILSTGGVASAVKGGVNKGLGAVGREAAKEGAEKSFKKFAVRAISRGIDNLVGSAAAAAVTTPLQAGMYNNYIDNALNEYATYGQLVDSPLQRMWKSYADAFTDTFTEHLGGVFTGAASYTLKNYGANATLGRIFGTFERRIQPFYRDILKRTAQNGVAGEIEEEMWANLLSPLMRGDSKEERRVAIKEAFSKEAVITTIATTAIMSAGFGVGKVLSAADATIKYEKFKNKAKNSLALIEDKRLEQTLVDIMALPTLQERCQAFANIDWQGDYKSMGHAADYFYNSIVKEVYDGAVKMEDANEVVMPTLRVLNTVIERGSTDIVTAQMDGNPVYIIKGIEGDAESVIVQDMDGNRSQVAISSLQELNSTPVSEVVADLINKEYNAISAEMDAAEQAEEDASLREQGLVPPSKKAMADQFTPEEEVMYDGQPAVVLSVDRNDGTARINIEGGEENKRVKLSDLQKMEMAPEVEATEEAEVVETPAETPTEQTTQEVATPKVEAVLNEAGEVDVVSTGEEQTANYLTQEFETPEDAIGYADDKIAAAQKALNKAQSNDKLPLNIAERKKVIAERKAEVARIESEIAMWEGVKARLTQPQQTEQEAASSVVVTEKKDNQGNLVDNEGKLIAEQVSSIDEITDEDFESPTRSIQLPQLPSNVDAAIGANGKPVVIKRNIFERNLVSHSDLTPEQSRQILKAALYSPEIYGQNQKTRKPYNWVVVSVGDATNANKLVLLEVNNSKENVEVVHWHYIDQRGLEKLKRQAEREDGQLLILPSTSGEEVGALADPTLNQPSTDKNTTSEPENQISEQENADEVEETTEDIHTREQVDALEWEAGVVMNEEARNHKATEAIDKMAKDAGVRVAFVDEVVEGGIEGNGLYDPKTKTIYIAKERDDKSSVRFVAGHEMLHHIKTLSPEAYKDYVEAVKTEMGKDFEKQKENIRKNYRTSIILAMSRRGELGMSAEDREAQIERQMPSDKVLTEEVVADWTGVLIDGTDGFSRFVKKHEGSAMLRVFRSALEHLRTFFTGKNSYERTMQRRLKALDTLLEDAVGEAKQSKEVKPAQKQTSIITPNNLIDAKSGKAMMSLRTYNESGRVDLQKFLSERVESGDLTQVDATDIITQMDEIYNICKEFTGKYGPFGQWSEASVVKDEDGNPVFSVIKKNGEYAMNLDFSLVCKKRRTLDAVLNEMIARGMIESATDDPVFIAQVNDVIRKYGFETACRLCFVDAKRFRVVRVAQQFADLYNSVVRSMLPKGSKIPINSFDYAQRGVEQSENALNTLPDSEVKIDALQKMSEGRSVKAKIAKHLLDNPQDRKLVSVSDFVSTKGFDAVATVNPALLGLYNSKKGSGGPKAAFSDVQYLGDVAKANWDVEKAYAVGGVRIQSFSDFVPRMIFDYIQMVGDLAAKNLPAHAYTKEPIFAKIFGKTGIKINLSLVPAVVENGVAAGLDAEGNYAWQEGETFPYEEAIALQNAEGYRENVGTIAVGVSDEHILKMLGDDNIRMVIPYHKSGLNPAVAKANNIDGFKDYTSEQNTRYSNGNKLSKEDAAQAPDFNQLLQELGSAKAAADAYLAWCAENGYKPKFDKFASHPNYYKLLEDFTTTVDGVNVPQEGVRMQFPKEGDAFGSLEELIERGLEEDAVLEGMRDEKVSQIVNELDGVRFSLREDTDSLLSIKAMDAPYLEAVERGDMETAQRMVMEAAKIAMPNTKVVDEDGNPKVVYHQTNASVYINRETGQNWDELDWRERMEWDERDDWDDYWEEREFNTFSRVNARTTNEFDGFFFAPEYDEYHEYGDRTIAAFVNIENPASREDYNIDSSKNNAGREERIRLQNEGYDGVIREFDGVVDEYIAFEPNQIKSADPVTYDDNGNVIPLSERFNPRREDIRFALRGEKGIENLHNASATIHKWMENNTRGKSFTIELPKATTEKVRKAMGKDFESHNITANGVAHAYMNHGENGRKLNKNSIPLRKEDVELIPYIMTAPDEVAKASTDITGRDSVRFYKNLSNGYVVVVEKEYKNSPNDMETITMWAELSSKATNARQNAAPDTHVRNAILDTDIAKIRKDAENAIEKEGKGMLSIRTPDTFYSNASENLDIRFALREVVPTNEPVTFDNFYNSTAGIWEALPISEAPTREPDYVSQRWDGIGVSSRYWYGEDEGGKYVIRESDHWSGVLTSDSFVDDFERRPYSRHYTPIASCRWALDGQSLKGDNYREKLENLKSTFEDDGGSIYGKIYLQDLTHYKDANSKFSLRLPGYKERFKALSEEYAALDKNDAQAVADFRARKRTLVEEYWNDFAKALGADVEVMVVDSTNNPEALRPIYDKLKEAIGDDSWFPSFRKFARNMQKAKPALYIAGTNTIGIDIARADKANTLKAITQMLLHENIHRIVDGSIDRKQLIEIWSEVGKTDFGKRIKKAYKRRSSSVLGNESLAYRIAGTQRTDINPLLDFIEGNNGVSVEDVLATYENSLPLGDEVVKQILNTLRNEYKEKGAGAEADQKAVKEEAVVARKIARDGTSSNRGRGRVGEEAGDLRVDGESRESYPAEGRRVITTEDGFTLEEVDIPEFDESPKLSLRDPIERLREENAYVTKSLNESFVKESEFLANNFETEGLGRKVEKKIFNYLADVQRLQENLYDAGVERTDDNDFINKMEAVRNIVAKIMPREYERFVTPLMEVITKITDKYGFNYNAISDYLAAKHSIEREDTSGIKTMAEASDAVWNRANVEKIVSDFESKVPENVRELLWRGVRGINQRTLDILQKVGVYTSADIEAIQSHNWEYYVPLQGWDTEAEELIEVSKVYGTPNASSNGRWQSHGAKGRKTKPYDPLATIVAKLNKAVYVAETNKALQSLYNLVTDATKVLGAEKASYLFKASDAYYRKTNDGYEEVDADSITDEELSRNKKLHSEIKKLYAERKKIGKYKNVQRWRRYNYELKRANEAGDVESSNKIQERLDSLRQTKSVQLLLEVDAKIDDVKSKLTIFVRSGEMAIPQEVGVNNELTKARRVYFYMNGKRMYIQFVNPKYATAISGQTLVKRNDLDRVAAIFTRFLSKSYTSLNPEFSFVTNPIRDFRDAVITHTLDVEHGNIGGFIDHYVFNWNTTRNAIIRAERGLAKPLTDDEIGDANIRNKDDRKALANKYGMKRVQDTLFQMFVENGGEIGFGRAYSVQTVADDLKKNIDKLKAGKYSTHANVYKALSDSAEVITRYATFLASLDKGESVGQAIANGRNVSVNFNRKGELSDKLGAHFSFFNASAQGIYKYLTLARKYPKRFALAVGAQIAMGYASCMLIDWLFTALLPDDDGDELQEVEIPLWERLGYTTIPVWRSNGKVQTIRIPKSVTFASFSAIGVLLNELQHQRITTKEALSAAASQMMSSWTYGFSEGAPFWRAAVPTALQPFADIKNNTDAFGREIRRTDKFDRGVPNSELGLKNVIPWIYEMTKALNKATGGNEFKSGAIDINPSVVQYIMQQFAGGFGVLARKTIELVSPIWTDQVEFEAQNMIALGRLAYTVEPKSWYPDYKVVDDTFGAEAFSSIKNQYRAGYISEEEARDFARRATVFKNYDKVIKNLIQLRNKYAPSSVEYKAINQEINRQRGLVVKIFEDSNFSNSENISKIVDKYDPNRRNNITNLYKEYAK